MLFKTRIGIRITKAIFDEVVSLELYHSKQYCGVCAHHVWIGPTAKYIDVNMVILLESKSRMFFFDGVISLE